MKSSVGERTVNYTAIRANAIAAESILGVEDGRSGEVADVGFFFPIGLATGIVAFVFEHLEMDVHVVAVEWEEPSNARYDVCHVDVGVLQIIPSRFRTGEVHHLGWEGHQASVGVEICRLLGVCHVVPDERPEWFKKLMRTNLP